MTSGEVFYPSSVSANVARNLLIQIPILLSTPLTLGGIPWGMPATYRQVWRLEIEALHMAFLSKEENHEIWKQSGHIWHYYARFISSVFPHCSVFVQRLCWNCTASDLEAAMNIGISRRYASHSNALCRHASSLPEPWNPTCKTGTMVWPIKHTDTISNTFWQCCKVSLELNVVIRARWIMQMFEHSRKAAQSLHFFSSELVDIFECITDFSLVLKWGKVSKVVTSLRALSVSWDLYPPSSFVAVRTRGSISDQDFPSLGCAVEVLVSSSACILQPHSTAVSCRFASTPQRKRSFAMPGKTAWCYCGPLSVPDSAPPGQYQLVNTQSVQGSPWLLPWPLITDG